ncbi:MAG: sn-glycerol-3-phosphate ABC transporter ATP-binding protein UgpC [Salaquimonas sp.]
MSGLNLKNVKKSFGSVDVIHGVDLEVENGEFVVFVGPSGCGKSTLLRLIAGLEDTSSGTISIGGRDVTHVEPSERGIAMVFQSYALYPHMTVYENMAFGLKMNGHSKEAIDQRVKKAADILELGNLLDRKPKAMSGGQRQRVAIGRSIVREPDVFLFDEPLSNLDAELRVQMRLEIAKLHQDLGATMVYVTHDQVEAMTLADKIVVLRAGIIEQYGSPMHLYKDPDNVFVGGFIGSPRMNFLEGTVTSTRGKKVNVTLDGFGATKLAIAFKGEAPVANQKVLIGIRPEHFSESAKIKLKTQIDVIENLGGTSYGYANSKAENPLTIQLSEGHKAKEGSTYNAGIDVERVYLFDAKTELRIR